MNSNMKRIFALLLTVSMLTGLLCGCDAVSSILGSKKDSDTVTLEYAVDLYEEPAFDASVVGSIEAGEEVKFLSTEQGDGVIWYETKMGWFALADDEQSEETGETAPPVKGNVIISGFATTDLELLDAASANANVIGTLGAGSLVEIYQTRDLWAQTVKGWVQFDKVYIPGHIGENAGWCYTLKSYMGCYSEPSFDSVKKVDLRQQQRVKLYEVINIYGVPWGYSDSGWLCLEDTYIEGTVGDGACRVKISDKTAVNVRVGPSTQYDVIRTLDIGTYVEVLDQVHNGTDYWGFVGDGWIYMGLVEVQ